jgi:hypothetical protein
MRVLLNAISARMGGAANYARNIAVELAGWRRCPAYLYNDRMVRILARHEQMQLAAGNRQIV